MQADDQMRVEDARLIRGFYGEEGQKVTSIACKYYSSNDTLYGAYVSDYYIGQFEIGVSSSDEVLQPISQIYLSPFTGHNLIGYNQFINTNKAYIMTEFYESSSRGIQIVCKNSTTSSSPYIRMNEAGRDLYVSTRMGHNSGSAIWTVMVDVNQSDPSKPLIAIHDLIFY